MKKISLLTVISLGIFALISCGNTAEKTNTEANKNVSSEKAFNVNEFVDKVLADEGAWKGKEVTVTGQLTGKSSYTLILVQDRKAFINKGVTCVLKDAPKQDLGETLEVRGKISRITNDSSTQAVELEPCEVKK